MKSFAVVAVVLGYLALVEAQCPGIVTRSTWGARAGSSSWLPINPAPWVLIHHTAGAPCSTRTACNTEMRSIQNQHMNGNGWSDIGYNFLVGGDGAIYEGRGWGKQGAHAPGYNDKSIGISFIGTYSSVLPSSAMLTVAKNLISCGVSNNYITSNHGVKGHRQAIATECPGQRLYDEIRTWPRFSP